MDSNTSVDKPTEDDDVKTPVKELSDTSRGSIFDSKSVPFLHRIDMYGSIFLLWMVWGVPYIIGAIRGDLVYMVVPYEMLMHGPITLNTSGDAANNKIVCNPHFATFLGSPAYLTDDFMGTVLTKGKSEAFLALPQVKQSLQVLQRDTNQSRIHLGIRLTKVCQLIRPHLETRHCVTYDHIFTECLKENCNNHLFLCWWNPLSALKNIVYVHAAVFCIGVVVMCLTMFDPPPVGFTFLARPGIVGMAYTTSSLLCFIYGILVDVQIRKYVKQPIFFEVYPSRAHGYRYGYGNGLVFGLVGASINFIFGIFYLYVTLFTPSYPRHRSRVILRREYLKHEMEKWCEEAGISTSSYAIAKQQ